MEEAIYSDCYLLISNFAQIGNPSFKSFCEEWKKLRFQHIFTAQTTYIELQQTAAAAFHIGKRLFCNKKTTTENTYGLINEFDIANEDSIVLVRIGGLYLLYAIYFKQPLEQYKKIEVSLETWREMKQFVSETLSDEYDEARYMFWKLYQSQAFRFTALDYNVGLENLVDYDNLNKSETYTAYKSCMGVNRLFQKLSSFDQVKQTAPALVALEDGYNQMKSSLTKKHKLDGQLLPPINIFQSIQKSFSKIENILNDAERTEEAEWSNQKSLKRALKDKAYGSKAKTTSSTTDNEESPKKHLKRMSSRTIFAEKLPKDIEEDLKANVVDKETRTENESITSEDDTDANIKSSSETDPLNSEHVIRVCKELLEGL